MNVAGLVVIAVFAMLLGPALAAGETPSPAGKPVNTEAPRLAGTPAVGQTLFCSQGGWTSNPTSFSYAWLRDGNPIAGQTASAYAVQSADRGYSISCQVTAGNSGGEYTIPGLSSGSYKVGFFTFESGNYVSRYFNGRASFSAADAVSVIAGSTTAGINAALSTGGLIAGKVTDALTHAPLAHIEVCANQVGGSGSGSCASTNAAGQYTISGLESGSYKIEFSAGFEGEGGNYAPQYFNGKSKLSEADAVTVTAGSTTGGVNAEMHSSGQIAGKVIDAVTKAPLANIKACVNEFGEFLRCVSTNSSGEYAISDLSGSYDVRFSAGPEGGDYATQYFNGQSTLAKAEAVEVTAGETKVINAEMHAGGRITGQVTDATTHLPLAHIEVCANEAGGESFLGNCVSTNAFGEYTILGLASGGYTVEFFAGPEGGNYVGQYFNGSSTLGKAAKVTVLAPETTEGVNAEMHPGGQIVGQVTDASTHAPLASIRACANGEGSSFCTSTNAAGEYTIPRLASSSYAVEFSACGSSLCTQNYATQFYNGKPSPSAADAVVVIAGSTTAAINAAMHPGGQIAGRVTDASSGAGIAGIEVCALKTSGGGFGPCALTNAAGPSASATSNALSVPPGDFTLVRKPVFDAKKGVLDFFFRFPTAGKLNWSLFFRNSDVGFADSLGLSLGAGEGALAEAARKSRGRSRRCKAGFPKRGRRCVRTLVPFGSGSESVPAGTVEVKVRASSKAIKALKAGRTLHVSGRFTFQSALGGPAIGKTESTVVRVPKRHAKHGKGKRH